MTAPTVTRRTLLTRAAAGFALACLLPACGQPAAPVSPSAVRQRTASLAGTPPPATPALPTPTLSAAQPVFLGREPCPGFSFPYDPKPSDPYWGGGVGERVAVSFADKVREGAGLIVLGTVRDILPPRWATPDGRRPENPHWTRSVQIFTPIRVAIEQVAKGRYTLPDIYFAEPGGRIGRDCASYSGSGTYPEFRYGERFLYFVSAATYSTFYSDLLPVPGDSPYRYRKVDHSYAVKPDGTITIGPEDDIMGRIVDSPPRTLTVDETLREIAALLAAPSATPVP